MKEISLTQGKVALVDDEDFERLNQYRWGAVRSGRNFYARRVIQRGKQRIIFRMHRVIMNPTPAQKVDHINRDGLDNRKGNLRVCSKADNNRNVGVRADNRSGFKGVYWSKQHQKWRAYIHGTGSRCYLGSFPDPVSAAQAYNRAAKDLHGEFAYLNPLPD